jgi:glycosyltransferase involved in cell wall biosynthesis
VPEDAAAPAAPVEQRLELLERRPRLAQNVPDQLGVVLPALEKELGVGMERTDLRPQAGGRQRQTVRNLRVVTAERGPRSQAELVGTHHRTREVHSVEEIEHAPSAAPSSWFRHGAQRYRQPRRVVTVEPVLSAVLPVYNGGDEILDNVGVIRRALATGLPGEEIEVIVVSDGSIDETAEQLLAAREDAGFRVIHYDRNLGKGYAVKAGALASHGEWIALIDADLDLDPASVPLYLDLAKREDLDFAIGSKRHPDSVVHYPRSRRIASWCYQQFNRLLFRLDVRDTQVGLKVFNRRVVDEVMPLLLVKQFAFDLELLAVSRALGFGRVKELPVRLEYRFTGSALGSIAVLRALWDTAAVFYRLRVLRTYQRKRRLLAARTRVPEKPPLVSVLGDHEATTALDYPELEAAASPRDAKGSLLALLKGGARPAGNWVSAAVPYFADAGVSAVVSPTLAPLRAPLRERVAAAVLESRLGGGSRRSSFFPGNVRTVLDHPAENIVVRRSDYLAALDAGVGDEELVLWLSTQGKRTIYTPDTSLAEAPAPLFRPHLDGVLRHARARGVAARRTRGRSLSAATALSLAPAVAAIVGLGLLATSGTFQTVGAILVLAYGAALLLSGVHAAVRFRSFAVGALEPIAVVASQAAYLVGFVRGLSSSLATRPSSRTFQSKRRA